MKFQVVKSMNLQLNGMSKEQITISKGEVVDSVRCRDIEDTTERVACENIKKRHQRRHPNQRVIFFYSHGSIRSAILEQDVVPYTIKRSRHGRV
jgi:hypothetical protein